MEVLGTVGPGGIAAVLVIAGVEVFKRLGVVSDEGARKAAAQVALVIAPIATALAAYGAGQGFSPDVLPLTWLIGAVGSSAGYDALKPLAVYLKRLFGDGQ